MSASRKKNTGRRAVIVGGVRTPFVKAFGQLLKLDTIALGVAAAAIATLYFTWYRTLPPRESIA